MKSKKYYIYRFLGEENNILYVGKSSKLKNRISGHFSKGHLSQDKYESVKKIEYTTLETRAEMDIYEIYYINKWKPEFNTQFLTEGEELPDYLQLPNHTWKNFKNIRFEETENPLNIPEEILSLKDISSRSYRVSDSLDARLNKFVENHKPYTKTALINYAISELIKKYKQN